MNKKLVAVAIAGLLAAPLAQAQTANVTLYGRANLDMEFVNGKQANGSNPNVFRVSTNSSRFGLRGSESLGGGLTAIFQLENSVGWDASGGTIAARESFVGLQGGWGTVKLGNYLSPYDDIHPIFGSVPTLLTSALSTGALWAQASQSNAAGGFDNRNPNSVRYDSPSLSGFTGSVQYSSQEGAPKSNSGIWALGGFYNNGPAQFGIAYAQNNQIRGAGLTDKALSIAGGWQFTGFRIGGVWERLQYDVTTSTDLKRDFWNIGATVNLGPGQMYASWGMAYDGKGSAPDCIMSSNNAAATNAAACQVGQIKKGNDTAANQWTVSYTYPLSKRTLSYFGYAKVINDGKVQYSLNPNAYAVANGGDPGAFVMGMVHFF